MAEEDELLLKEIGHICAQTRHVVDVQIIYSTKLASDGFWITLEDENHVIYKTFLSLRAALVDYRLDTLGILPDSHENRQQIARNLVSLVKLGNVDNDGRKLNILFDPLPKSPVRKVRPAIGAISPATDESTDAAQLAAIQGCLCLPAVLTPKSSPSRTPKSSPATTGYTRKVIKEVTPTPIMEALATPLSDTLLMTSASEDLNTSSLIALATPPSSSLSSPAAAEPLTSISTSAEQASSDSISNSPASTKSSSAKKKKVVKQVPLREATITPLSDTLLMTTGALEEVNTLKGAAPEASTSSSTIRRSSSSSPSSSSAASSRRSSSPVKKKHSPPISHKAQVFQMEKYFGHRKLPVTFYEEDHALIVVIHDGDIDGDEVEYSLFMHMDHFSSLGLPNSEAIFSLAPSEKEAAFQTVFAAIDLVASERDGVRRIILRPEVVNESLSKTKRVSGKVHEQTQVIGDKSFIVAVSEDDEGITVTATPCQIGAEPGVTSVPAEDSVSYELHCDTEMMQTLRSRTVRSSLMKSNTEGSQRSGGEDANGDSILETIVQSLELVPGKNGTQNLGIRSSRTSTEVVLARIRLYVKEKRFSNNDTLFDVSIYEEDDSIVVTAHDKKHPHIVYEHVIPQNKLQGILPFEIQERKKLSMLTIKQKAELCAYIYDHLGLESKSPDVPRQLVVHKHKRHLPKRQGVLERKKILRIIQPNGTISSSDTSTIESQTSVHKEDSLAEVSVAPSDEGNAVIVAPLDDGLMKEELSVVTTSSADGSTVSAVGGDISQTYDAMQTQSLHDTIGSSLCSTITQTSMTQPYELFSRSKTFAGERILLLGMYDMQNTVKVAASEIYKETLELIVSGSDLLALGCPSFKELTLDQRIEVCEKIFNCIKLEVVAQTSDDDKPQERLELCLQSSPVSRIVTLMTRGLTLGGLPCIVSILEEDDVVTIRAEDVLIKQKEAGNKLDRVLTSEELSEAFLAFGTNYASLNMVDKLSVCEMLLRWINIIVEDDGVTRSLDVDFPSKVAERSRSLETRHVVVCHPCATPVSSQWPNKNLQYTTQATSSPVAWRRTEAIPKITLLFQKTKTFGDRVMDVSIFEVPPKKDQQTGCFIVRAVDSQTLETHYLLLDKSICRETMTKSAATVDLAQAVLDRLALLPMNGATHLMVVLNDDTSSTSFPGPPGTLLSSTSSSQYGSKMFAYDNGNNLWLVLQQDGAGCRQVLAGDYLKELGYCRGGMEYKDLSKAVKIELAEDLFASREVELLAATTDFPQSIPMDMHEFLISHFPMLPSSSDTTLPTSAICLGNHVRGIRQLVNGWAFEYQLAKNGDGVAQISFKDIEASSCSFSFELSEKDAVAIGFKNLEHAFLPANLLISASRFAACLSLSMVSISDQSLFSSLADSIDEMMQEENRPPIEYIHYANQHLIGNETYELGLLVEGDKKHLRICTYNLESGQESEVELYGSALATFLPPGQQVKDLTDEEKATLIQNVLDVLVIDAKGKLQVVPKEPVVPEVTQERSRRRSSLPMLGSTGSIKQIVRQGSTRRGSQIINACLPATEIQQVETAPLPVTVEALPPIIKHQSEYRRRSFRSSACTIPQQSFPLLMKQQRFKSLDEMWGLRPFGTIAPTIDQVETQKKLTLTRYRANGVWPAKTRVPYLMFWDKKLRKLMAYISHPESLRKAISVLQQSHRHLFVSAEEGLCALAAMDGSVAEANAQLTKLEFYQNIKLASEVIDFSNYDPYLELCKKEKALIAVNNVDRIKNAM